MRTYQQKQQRGFTIFALMLLVIFQSCNKDELMELETIDKALVQSKKKNQEFIEWTSVAPEACKQVCLVAGQHMYVGTVDVAMQDGDLFVTYTITTPDIYLEEIHLDIFSSIEELEEAKKISKGGAIPGKFEFKKSWDSEAMVTSYTVNIPQSYVDEIGANCFFIASHAALSNGETAWGGLCNQTDEGTSIDEAKQFPGKNWSIYFEFCKDECTTTIDFTYAWEDVIEYGGDSDYNDLVIKSDIIKTASELKLTFLATARGAGFDHKFKIKIPKAGITEVFGAASLIEDDNFYYISIFESTKAVLPGFGNTNPLQSCIPFAYREIVLTIDASFSYDPSFPYEPFISVYNSGNTSIGDFYDLYIYEVSGTDKWKDQDGKEFPNGILIPDDWKWPIENMNITIPYPDFTNLTDGWTADWASNLADPSKTFDTSICD